MNISQAIRMFDPDDIYKNHFETDPDRNESCQICKDFNKKHLDLFALFFCAVHLFEKHKFIEANTKDPREEVRAYSDKLNSFSKKQTSAKSLKTCRLAKVQIKMYQILFDEHIFINQIPKEIRIEITDEVVSRYDLKLHNKGFIVSEEFIVR